MNLLELMLKEEVTWPVGAEFAAQDSDDSRVYFYVVPPAKSDSSDKYWITKEVLHVGSKNLSALSNDWSTRVIPRGEYQAAGGVIAGSASKPADSIDDDRVGRPASAATAMQAKPSGQGNPILGMVLADLTNRALEGKEKYGEPLKAHNGRNALWDAYQEALDLTMYLRQLIQEQAE